jgi:hypothetical protein
MYDVSKIPFWGDVTNSEGYQQAEAALRDNPQVDTVIGHSLGGSVALELNKQNNNQLKKEKLHDSKQLYSCYDQMFPQLNS